jgi:hypothetical protein
MPFPSPVLMTQRFAPRKTDIRFKCEGLIRPWSNFPQGNYTCRLEEQLPFIGPENISESLPDGGATMSAGID